MHQREQHSRSCLTVNGLHNHVLVGIGRQLSSHLGVFQMMPAYYGDDLIFRNYFLGTANRMLEHRVPPDEFDVLLGQLVS